MRIHISLTMMSLPWFAAFLIFYVQIHEGFTSCLIGQAYNETLPLGKIRFYCKHEGKKIGVGSTFITDDCHKCSCSESGFGCCGIEMFAGVFHEPDMLPGCRRSPGGGKFGCGALFMVKDCGQRKCRTRRGRTCYRDCFTGRRISTSEFVAARKQQERIIV